jgi:DNA polymerase V
MNYIGVIDCNNFFVSCERLFRPDLRHKPVLVLSSNDGCVVARSQEIKDMGIPMGVPYFQIKDIIKDSGTVCFSSHFALYRDISARVMSVVRDSLSVVEVYSIDEAFFSCEAADKDELMQVATALKAKVERLIGMPVSIGIAATKTQAKLANTVAKKNGGVAVFTGSEFIDKFRDTPLQTVWGVGGKLGRRYREASITTVGEFLATDPARVVSLAGVVGARLLHELSGQIAYMVTHSHEQQKSLMSSRSFHTKTNNLPAITDSVAYHVRHVFEELRSMGLVAASITLLLQTARHGDWSLRGGSARVDCVAATDSTAEALKIVLPLLANLYEKGVPYSKSGVLVSGLLPKACVPKSLFQTSTQTENFGVLDTLMDSLNARFGKHSLLLGKHAAESSWQAKHEVLSKAYTTSWQQLAVVYAKDQ